jgi:hypothetical protein
VHWQLSVSHFLIPKAGLSSSECEDALAIRGDLYRFCIADGATEGFDSRRWAKLLTKHWVSSRRLLTREEFEFWMKELGDRLQRRWAKQALPWYAEEKARNGAFAAFVGLAFLDSIDGLQWQTVALGDSCLIQKRRARIITALPLSNPNDFGNRPILVPSNPAAQGKAIENVIIDNGMAEPGDVFLLLTDAIAAWYLRAFEVEPIRTMQLEEALSVGDQRSLEALIARERATQALRNDDVAILKIVVQSSANKTGSG